MQVLSSQSHALDPTVKTPRARLRVVHVVLSLEVGGLEHVVLDLVRQGLAAGQDVSVLCVERTGALAPQVEALGAPVVCIDKVPGLSPRSVRDLRRAFAGIRPDVIHTHQLAALAYVRASFLARHRPVVVHTEHGKHYSGRWRNRLLGRFGSGGVDRFFCVSADVAAEVRQCHVARSAIVQVVPNGIDTARFSDDHGSRDIRAELNIPAGARVVGTVGRLAEIKRQDLLIQGFAEISKACPDTHLLLIGDGPMRADLQELARKLNLADRVHFAGYRADPAPFVRSMSVFALTSRSEGMPLSVLEAWAAGVPVVASRVGGLPELIRQDSTGLLFESGSAPEFAASVLRVLGDGKLRGDLIAAARRRVQTEFDVRVMAARYAEFYHSLASTKAAPRRRAAARERELSGVQPESI